MIFLRSTLNTNSELKNVSPSFLLSVLECVGHSSSKHFLRCRDSGMDMETEEKKHFKESDFMLPMSQEAAFRDD